MGRTRSRNRAPKGSASAALLSACSGRCYIPGRPRRVTAKPEAVGTGSRRSGITEGIMGHDPVAMARMAGSTVSLYTHIRQSSIRLTYLRGVNNVFTAHLNLDISLPAAP